jgi:HRD ubiquitin ligase complex, ER membrane component
MAVVVSAVVTAIEVGTLAAALTAVATVGTAMTVVGVVTHSKELTKIGGVLALVGGVGGLVNGAIGAAAGAAAEGAAASGIGAAAEGAEAGWAGMANDAVAGVNSAGIAPIAFDGASATASGAASAAPGLATSNSLGAFLGTPAASSASGVPGIVPDAAGAVATDTSSPFLNDYGLPTGGATDKALGVNGPLGVQDLATPANGDLMGQLKSKLGSAWDGLGATGKAELLKSVLAMPGGIQNQKNVEAGLAIQQQKVNQTSYGSQVPTFGIINKAKGG